MGTIFNAERINKKRLWAFIAGVLLGTLIIYRADSEFIFYIAISSEYNRMMNERVRIEFQRYLMYIFFKKIKFAILLYFAYRFSKIKVADIFIFLIFGIIFAITISGSTAVFGENGIINSVLILSELLYYLLLFLIFETRLLTNSVTYKSSMYKNSVYKLLFNIIIPIVTIIFFTFIYSLLEIVSFKFKK